MKTSPPPPVIDVGDLTIGNFADEVDAGNALLVEMEVNFALAQARQAVQEQLQRSKLFATGFS